MTGFLKPPIYHKKRAPLAYYRCLMQLGGNCKYRTRYVATKKRPSFHNQLTNLITCRSIEIRYSIFSLQDTTPPKKASKHSKYTARPKDEMQNNVLSMEHSILSIARTRQHTAVPNSLLAVVVHDLLLGDISDPMYHALVFTWQFNLLSIVTSQ